MVLIAVNQLKLHETSTVTLALKNIAMLFPAADYYGHPRSTQRHGNHFFEDMHSFIAGMAHPDSRQEHKWLEVFVLRMQGKYDETCTITYGLWLLPRLRNGPFCARQFHASS